MNNNSLKSKLIAVFFTAVLLISLTGCALTDALTAYSLYAEAAKKLKKAGGYEADCVLTMSFDIFGSDISQSINMNVKQKGKDSQLTTSMAGIDDVITTRIGNTVYVESGDAKVKYHSDGNSSADGDSLMEDGSLPKLSKDLFDGIEVSNGENGRKSITLNIDNETAANIFDGYFGEDEEMSFSMENMIFVFTFDKKKNLETMQMSCDVTMGIMGMSIGGKITADYTFINFGTAPEFTINYPEDEYEDGGEYTNDNTSIFNLT